VPFVKAGARPGASGAAALPPGASAGTGTRIGGDTSRVKGLGQGEVILPAKAPAEEEKESPFGDLGDAPAAAPVPKKAKKERKEAQPTPAAWWKRPAVLAGAAVTVLALLLVALWAAGVFKVKTKDGTLVLENLPDDAEVLVDGEKVTVTWGADRKSAEVTVQRGSHQVVAKQGGIEVIGEKVEIKDGKRSVLTARFDKQTPPNPNPDPSATKPVDPDRKAAADPFQPNSVWVNAAQKLTLTVIERKGEKFLARFESGDKIVREVSGTVKDGKVTWLAKDVRAIKGKVGGDNQGTITKDKDGNLIDFVWRHADGPSGTFTLRLRG